MLGALLACVLAMADPIPPDLDAYVKRPDPSFAWSEKKPGLAPLHLRMTSQTWQNVRWTHDIVVAYPEGVNPDALPSTSPSHRGAAILYITGGEPNKADRAEAQKLANLSHLPVAHLFQIPNQPLFGKNEDDLIAHTFEKYLTTGESDWILLFPMVKSAVRAMDALQAATRNSRNPLTRFIVTGASKRGWTAWLCGAIQDKRVIGIAPMVFDNLRFREQLKHQLDSWGKFSEMIADYTDRGLDKVLDTPEGKNLVAMADPWTYRSRITMPKLIVNGSNDRYWCVDSLSLYWDGLVGPKYCSIVPNAGHLLGDMKQALNAIAAFARSCAGEFVIAPQSGGVRIVEGKRYAYVSVQDADPTEPPMNLSQGKPSGFWTAATSNGDFRDAKWTLRTSISIGGAGRLSSTILMDPVEETTAVWGQVQHRFSDIEFLLSVPVQVLKKN